MNRKLKKWIDGFIRNVIDGYIKGDLERIRTLKVKPGKAGNLNYPLALCVLCYIDGLASFMAEDDKFQKRFKSYVKHFFPNKSNYIGYEGIFRNLRNPLAHSYFANITRNRVCKRPLFLNDKNELCLEADILCDDFLASLVELKKKLLETNFAKGFYAGYKSQKNEYQKNLKKEITKIDQSKIQNISQVITSTSASKSTGLSGTSTTTVPPDIIK